MSFGVNIRSFGEEGGYYSRQSIAEFGPTVVLAPHPDDESLGCGGIIALLRQLGVSVSVIFVSDGSMSHPQSIKYPQPVLALLREEEAVQASEILGVEKDRVYFMRLKDSMIPMPGKFGFEASVEQMTELLQRTGAQTMITPWRRDPHRDHRATWHIAASAVAALNRAIRVIEYPIWLWERAATEDYPLPGEMHFMRADVSDVLLQKNQAIHAHKSQVTRMIDDDAEGFWLSPEAIAHFQKPFEIFFESNNNDETGKYTAPQIL